MEHLPRADYKPFISQDKEFLIFKKEVTLHTFVTSLTTTELIDLQSTVFENIEDKDQELLLRNEMKQISDSGSDVLEYFKSYFEKHFGNIFYIDFLDQEIPLNFKVVERCLIKENLGKIPANTPDTFYKVFHDNTINRFSMSGESKVDIYPEQIIFKNRVNWDRAKDFSYLSGPGFVINANTPNKQAILKAMILIHKERSGEMFSSSDVFNKAQVDAYQHKLTKFLEKFPVFRNILIKTGRGNQYWKLNVPLNI